MLRTSCTRADRVDDRPFVEHVYLLWQQVFVQTMDVRLENDSPTAVHLIFEYIVTGVIASSRTP